MPRLPLVVAFALVGCGGSSDAVWQRASRERAVEVILPQIAADPTGPPGVASAPPGAAARAARVEVRRASPARRATVLASAVVLPPKISGGLVPNAAATTDAMAPDFRRCLEASRTPTGRRGPGEIMIAAEVGPRGEVLSASAVWAQGLPHGAIGCFAARVAAARFAPPLNGSATVLIAADTEIL